MYCTATRRVLSPLTEEERYYLLTQAQLCTLVDTNLLSHMPDRYEGSML
jgi:glycerol dehydrogenase-like iron-containing ADH family enzyme